MAGLTDLERRSADGLDDYWLPLIDHGFPTEEAGADLRGRRRVFYRYLRYGESPAKLRGLNGKWLLDVIHADPRMERAKALYNSELWELATARPPGLDRTFQIHRALLERLGLVQLTVGELRVAQQVRFMHQAALTDAETVEHYDRALFAYEADGLALLVCELRLAIAANARQLAGIYRRLLDFVACVLVPRWHAQDMSDAVSSLVANRLGTAESFPPFWDERPRGAQDVSLWDGDWRSYCPSDVPAMEAPIVALDLDLERFFRNYRAHYNRAHCAKTAAWSVSRRHPPKDEGDRAQRDAADRIAHMDASHYFGELKTRGSPSLQGTWWQPGCRSALGTPFLPHR